MTAADDVRIWIGDPYALDQSGLRRAEGLLTDEERRDASRFYFEADRRVALYTRAMVRLVLTRTFPMVEPEEWTFARTPKGRPYVTNPAYERAIFNVSHTRELVVCGIARGGRLGVDIESRRGRAPVSIARHYFSAAESNDLEQTPPPERALRFIQYWTLKESYLKARGDGLTLPLDAFTIALEDGRPRLTMMPPDDERRWTLHLDDAGHGHVLAVCRSSDAQGDALRIVKRPFSISCSGSR